MFNVLKRRDTENIFLALMILGGSVFFTGFILDNYFATSVETTAIVTDKRYFPAHDAQTSHGMVYRVAPEFEISFKFEGTEHQMSIDKRFYDSVKIGTVVRVNYMRGRVFWWDMKIKPPYSYIGEKGDESL